MKVDFPKLFKKTSTGAIQFWEISVDNERFGFGRIETCYGQLGTDSPQVTEEHIEEGKNIGKKNETTPFEQAQKEAQARWEKQKKKGYVESIEAAQAGEVDEIIEGGLNPMLAHKHEDHGHKIKYPAAIQPKLDGIRCIAIVKNGKCTLWSRTRKPITSMPHIVEEIEHVFAKEDIILDGELYNHGFKTNFEHIVSLVRQEKPDLQHRDVQYHIYDSVASGSFEERFERISLKIHAYEKTTDVIKYLITVPTRIVESEEKAYELFAHYLDKGFEGAMLRNLASPYANKRSYDLQKMKEFVDEEFEIIGIDEGRGKLAGHVGAFVCRTREGKEFLAKMSGSTERLRDYFQDHSLWKGKKLTVQYQGLTGAEKVPRFPVGKVIRDYE